MKNKNILIVGVGGQGTLLASRILGNLAIRLGFDVKVSEVHGMAQRGGSVVTHVRFGKMVHSPLVEPGEADIILAFEKLEALRWHHYLKAKGVMIVNDQSIDPMPVIMGVDRYPEDILETIKGKNEKVFVVDGLSIAKDCGNERVVNTVLLGVLAKHLHIQPDHWLFVIEETVPEKTIALNKQAFLAGYDIGSSI
ncbi:MAG: indolepyruvate oxidoreductase subunit beta [Clostridia bacterium]